MDLAATFLSKKKQKQKSATFDNVLQHFSPQRDHTKSRSKLPLLPSFKHKQMI